MSTCPLKSIAVPADLAQAARAAALVNHLELFGVLVLAFVSALGGGMIRDVLMGAVPPSALRG